MFPYVIVFAYPAIMAMLQPTHFPWKSLRIWIPTAIFYILFIGLRHEVGSDWFNYLDMFNRDVPGMGYGDIVLSNDPGFWVVMVWAYSVGQDMHLVDFVAAIIFVSGMVAFLRRLPNPWLGLTVLMAYTILTLGMGYVRQGMALGFAMWAITALMDKKLIKFFFLIALAATFHKSAVLMLGFGLFVGGKNKFLKVLASIVMGAGIYATFMSGEEKHLVELYINNEDMQSSGAYIRVFMNVVAASFFFVFRKSWKERWPESYTLWMLMTMGSFAAFAGVWFYSTAVDRVSLYFIPLQVAVFASLPVLMRSRFEPKFMTLMIIAYYASVYIVWLGFAAWAYMWLPYENILPVWLDGWLW